MTTADPSDPRAAPYPPVLTGPTVRLRPWSAADAPALLAACQDPDIRRWTTVPSPYGPEQARDFLTDVVPASHARGGASFCVERRDDPGVAASIALLHRRDGHGEIGYWTAPWARGRGVLREALGVLTRWCFDELGMTRLELLVEPANAASRAVAVRAGFVEEGVLRHRLTLRGEPHDVVSYSRLPSDP